MIDILLRYKSLTFQEISELWKESGLGYGEEMPLRTFHNHRNAIKDIFDVYIECDRKNDYRYHIDEPERLRGNNLRGWLVSSYATLNQIQVDCRLEERIIFEDIPSGQTWLTRIAEAMRYDQVLCITHQGFGKPEPSTFEIEPYCLKVVKRRWMCWLAVLIIQSVIRRWVSILVMCIIHMRLIGYRIFRRRARLST